MNTIARPVSEIIDQLIACAARDGKVTMGEMMAVIRYRSYGPFLLLPALIGLSPLGLLPGVRSALALVIIVFVIQMAVGRKHIWLPHFLERRAFTGHRVEHAMEHMRPWAERVDRWFHGRLPWFTRAAPVRLAALVCLLLALPMPLFEVIPFASMFAMIAIAGFGLAMTTRDGALMLFSFFLTVGAVGGGIAMAVLAAHG